MNIFFHKDNTYEYKYYIVDKDNKIIDKLKKGKYCIDSDMTTLSCNDGWDDNFNGVMYHKYNGTYYYLSDKDDDLYMVKGSD